MHNLLAELEEYIPNMSEGADKKKAQKPLYREINCRPQLPQRIFLVCVYIYIYLLDRACTQSVHPCLSRLFVKLSGC